MSSKPLHQRRSAAFFVACVLLLALVASFAGCRRKANEVPELQGQAAIDARGAPAGFLLLTAGRGEHEGEVALELAFSQALVASQEFDQLLVVKDAKGALVKGSWVLSEDGRTLSFPHVQPSQTYSVLVRAGLASAAGRALGKDESRKVFTGTE